MGKFCNDRWIDLGDFGQHKATVSGILGEFGYVTSVQIEVKGETIELVRILPASEEQIILQEVEIDESCYRREQAEDRKFDDMKVAA